MQNEYEKAEKSNPAQQAEANAATLSPAAERALREAEERRRASASTDNAPKEVGGRSGPEPTRYGDWEKKGIVSDF